MSKEPGFRRALKSVFTSRLFLVSAVVWIIFLLLIVSLSENSQFSYSPAIPAYQTRALSTINGNNLTIYSQTFNEFGTPLQEGTIAYSLSEFSGASGSTIESGTARINGSTTSYTLAGLPGPNMYTISETVTAANGTPLDSLSYPLALLSQGGTLPPAAEFNTHELSITPVADRTDPSMFSLHIWEAPGYNYSGSSLQLWKSPNFLALARPATDLQPGIASIAGVLNFTGEANMPVPVQMSGNPYYYEAAVIQSGSVVSQSFFTTQPTVQAGMQHTWTVAIAMACLPMVLWGIVGTVALSGRETPLIRSPEIIAFAPAPDGPGDSYRLFSRRVAASVLSSLPLILISCIIPYALSFLIYGLAPSLLEVVAFGSAGVLIVAESSSLTSLLMLRGRKGIRRLNEMEFRVGLRFLLGPIFLFFYIFLLGGIGVFEYTFASSPGTMTLLFLIPEILNPFSYVWLMASYASSNLYIFGQYSFVPLSYGLSPAILALIGLVDFILLLALPMAVYHAMQERGAGTSTY